MNAPDQQSAAAPKPPAAAPLRIGLVGCGTVGNVHRERLMACESVQITAICDPDADALSAMAGRLPRRPRLFRSEQDLLAAGIVDAVVLCTPHARHEAQVRAALEADVHVLCEKPFVTEENAARALVDEARRRNLLLFVSYTRRSRGHARFLLNAAARIGPLSHIVVTRAQPWLQKHGRTWRMRSEEGGGFLLDAGASMLDLILRLVGNGDASAARVTDLNADLWRRAPSAQADVDVRASIRLAFARGAWADLILLGDATEQVERIQLFGENGTAGWILREDTPFDLYLRPAGGPSEAGDPRPLRAPLPDAAFVAAVRAHLSGATGGDASGSDLYDAASVLPVVALVEQVYHQASWK